jgi:hypothetical protein
MGCAIVPQDPFHCRKQRPHMQSRARPFYIDAFRRIAAPVIDEVRLISPTVVEGTIVDLGSRSLLPGSLTGRA